MKRSGSERKARRRAMEDCRSVVNASGELHNSNPGSLDEVDRTRPPKPVYESVREASVLVRKAFRENWQTPKESQDRIVDGITKLIVSKKSTTAETVQAANVAAEISHEKIRTLKRWLRDEIRGRKSERSQLPPSPWIDDEIDQET